MDYIIREMREDEYPLLKEFLYEAVYVAKGAEPPDRSITDSPELHADVPVFSIMFGSADPTQLESLAELTHARVFDGREDLIGAFRSVKGYN